MSTPLRGVKYLHWLTSDDTSRAGIESCPTTLLNITSIMKTLTWQNTCQKCKNEDNTTRSREIYTNNYMGPCGDSFCYASCTMETCRSIRVVVCDNCEKELKK
jgi:hypothetical protein